MSEVLSELPLLLDEVPDTLRQVLAQEGVPHVDRSLGVDGRFVLFDSRRSWPNLRTEQIGIDIDHLRRGRTRDPFVALAGQRSACHEWPVGGLSVRETVSRVNRSAIRSRLIADLRVMVESAGGLWLTVGRYPAPYQTAFNFRLDHDEYDEADFDATLAAISGYEHCVSHYVCAATHARHPAALVRLHGMHVGSHGWWHHTYREKGDNLVNIRRGIECLQASGVEPVGFAAPHGRFHRELLAALDELGVGHSSEFGLAYDDLPFFPDQTDVLQIPIHPVCLGICLEAAARRGDQAISEADIADTVFDHWQVVMLQKHRVGDPIFLYGHPDRRLGRFPGLLRETLIAAGKLENTWRTTLANFETWWRARSAIKVSAERQGDHIHLTVRGCPSNYATAVEVHRDRQVATVSIERPNVSFGLGDLPWRRRRASRQIVPAPIRVVPGVRAGLRLYLDWEHVTPIDEISTGNWRGWAKRTLRRMRA